MSPPQVDCGSRQHPRCLTMNHFCRITVLQWFVQILRGLSRNTYLETMDFPDIYILETHLNNGQSRDLRSFTLIQRPTSSVKLMISKQSWQLVTAMCDEGADGLITNFYAKVHKVMTSLILDHVTFKLLLWKFLERFNRFTLVFQEWLQLHTSLYFWFEL